MDQSPEFVRDVSQAAFGQRYRLEVMLQFASAEDSLLCLSDLASAIGTAASNLQKPLRSLLDTGLITQLDVGDSKRKFYLRNPSAAWEWALELKSLADGVAAHSVVSLSEVGIVSSPFE